MKSSIQAILILAVRVYRWTLSPAKAALFGPSARCRFQPSCSEFALDALKTYGPWSGSWLSIKRVCRCHPWGGCGYDPVPEKSLPGTSKTPKYKVWFPKPLLRHRESFCQGSSVTDR